MPAPTNLKYTKSYEWLLVGAGGTVTVGITDYAQKQLGDLVFVDLPKVGSAVSEFCVVESGKAASELCSPVDGEICEVNTELADEPELVNEDLYGTWLVKIKTAKGASMDGLLDAAAYEKLVADSD